MLDELAKERDAASEELDFEKAASIHAKIQKVEAVAALASEAIHPLAQLRAVIVHPSSEPGHVALFQLTAGALTGPALYDTLGMRLHNEQSGIVVALYPSLCSRSCAAPGSAGPVSADASRRHCQTRTDFPSDTPRDVLEQRLNEAMDNLNQEKPRANNQTLADHLSIFNRWYFRPEAKRIGEAVFYDPEKPQPSKQILRAIFASFSARCQHRLSRAQH